MQEISSLPAGDTTALLMACRNGRLDIVRHVLEAFPDFLEMRGSVSFDSETIEGATPLWCAAAAGQFNVVQALIEHNASVNCTTKTNSTPLRAACFDGHFDIVKFLIEHGADMEIPNLHGHTCLMIACYKGHFKIAKYLVKCGADINRKSVKGNTALHDCAECGNLPILKMLIRHGAKFEADSCGVTPLLSAAIYGHPTIVEYFIESNCSKQEKIDALELLGATYIDKKHELTIALDYWKQAMMLRYEDANFILEKPSTQSPFAVYVNATEVHTLEQLDNLIVDQDEMKMQSLLVRERVLGSEHADTTYYIRYRGAASADIGNFDRCIHLWMYALDIQLKSLEPLSPMTQSSFLSFAELFSYMMSDHGARAVVSFHLILAVLQRAVKEIERAMEVASKDQSDQNNTSKLQHILLIVMHILGLISKLKLSEAEDLELKRAVYQFVNLDPRGKNGLTPLHLACMKESSSLGRYPVFTFPSSEVVNLLLQVGACPNEVDVDNNTPLHVAAMNMPRAIGIFETLLDQGAHLDFCNISKQTPLELAQNHQPFYIQPLKHINLQCLIAKVIHRFQIPYRKLVDKKLEAFLDRH